MNRIAQSIDEILAIAEKIDSTYTPSPAAIWVYAILGLFIVLFLPAMYIVDPPDSSTLLDFVVYGGVVALSVFLGVTAFVSHCSVYSVNPTGFSQVSPIRIGSWTMQPYDVVAADLEFVKLTRVLVLTSANGKTRRIPLFGELAEKFAEQFPVTSAG